MKILFLSLLSNMKCLPLFLAILVFSKSSNGGLTPTKYMLNYCRQRTQVLYLNDSLILELSNNVIGSRDDAAFEHCKLKVRVPTSKHILLQFFELRITDSHGTPDRLKIYDNVPNQQPLLLTPRHGAYGTYPREKSRGVKDYNSSYNELELNYFGKPTVEAPGFKLLLTPFIKEIARRKCQDGYFHCSISRICIRSGLACDGYQNCGTKDGSDEGKCRYYAEAQKSKSIFQGPVLLALIVSVVAIVVFIGVALIIMLLTRRFNRRSMAKLKTARKKRRTQDYTSTNNLTQNYDPPPYEDVMRTVTDPPSYNITSDEAAAADSGAGEGGKRSPNFTGDDDDEDERRKMMLMMMMMKNGHGQGPHFCEGGSCKKKYRNDHIALTQQKLTPKVDIIQIDKNYCGLNQPLKVALPPPRTTTIPLRTNPVNHIHNCSVTIESPVSSSTATYSHRISNRSSGSSNNDFELQCSRPEYNRESPSTYHDDMVYINNHIEMNDDDGCDEMEEHGNHNGDILEGATACYPAVIPSLSESVMCNGNVSPSYSGVSCHTEPAASATPIVLNGVVVDDDGHIDEDYDESENEEYLPGRNLFSEIDSFLYADGGGSGSCSPQDNAFAPGLVAANGNAYQCQNNTVLLRTKNPESCMNGHSHGADNAECCTALRLPTNIGMATRQSELVSPEPEAVRLLQ